VPAMVLNVQSDFLSYNPTVVVKKPRLFVKPKFVGKKVQGYYKTGNLV